VVLVVPTEVVVVVVVVVEVVVVPADASTGTNVNHSAPPNATAAPARDHAPTPCFILVTQPPRRVDVHPSSS
jgi:hypothetical protein